MSEEKKTWTIEITDHVLEQMANDPELAKAVVSFSEKVKFAGAKFEAGEYASIEEAMAAEFPGMREVSENEL